MKGALHALTPAPVIRWYRRWREWDYRRQPMCSVTCGNFVLQAPVTHVLATLGRRQPFRDLCVGISAKFVAEKYPDATLLDVGANIGDTAAMMASYTGNKIIAVEPSDYYSSLLRENLRRIPNEVIVHHVLIADGSAVPGTLRHGGGTAVVKNQGESRTMPSRRLSEVADDHTRFVKLDTDGYDFRIIGASLDWLKHAKPALLFEDQIRSRPEVSAANQTFRALAEIGYCCFIVWDDPGNMVAATESLAVIEDMNLYQCRLWELSGNRGICNYDILCLAAEDKDIFHQVHQWFRTANDAVT